jgi:hypothetical protein
MASETSGSVADVTPDSPWLSIDSIPSHRSPSDDGVAYAQIDRLPYRVKVGAYTGAQIRAFAHPPIGPERELWLLVPGAFDRPIDDDDSVEIDRSGLRFFTNPRVINDG